MSGLTCPECGADLREVGIRPAGGSGGACWRCWTLALPIPALFLWAWFYNAARRGYTHLRQERLIDRYGGFIGKNVRATTEGSQVGWGAAALARDIPPQRLVLHVDSSPAAHPIGVVAAADEIPLAQGTALRYPSNSDWAITAHPVLTRRTSEVPPWVAPAAGGFLLLVWLAGLAVIWSRYR